MWQKINNILISIPATVISLILLLISFTLMRTQWNMAEYLSWAPVLISGIPQGMDAAESLVKGKGLGKISSPLLIVIAMIGAVIIGDLFAAGEVAVIMAIGTNLEEMTTNRAKRGISGLLDLAPTMGRLIMGDTEKMIPAEEIRVGDLLRILPGEAIPVDGVIVRGETSVDQSIMTGESIPVDKGVEDSVFCGTINRFGVVDIKAVSESADSSLQKMVRVVQEADKEQAPTARIVDRLARFMVPASLLIALAVGLITGDPSRSVTVLLVFCPCALVLATPTAVMAAIGQATKHGVLIKSGAALETMGKVGTFVFDKTGTLTCGSLEVSDVCPCDPDIDERTLLSLCASAEAKSEHPLGRAVVSSAKKKEIPLTESDTFRMTTGKGIYAVVSGKCLLCGNERYMGEHGITIPETFREQVESLRSQGKAMILVAADGRLIGLVALCDTVRMTAGPVIAGLKKLGIQSALLTGDHPSTANYFASRVGITEVHAGLLPEDKADRIKQLRKAGQRVCMVGDGVNDALGLKIADVGIAMGGIGSDIATESADIALMSDDISRLPYLKQLSDATVRTIKIGIAMSMGVNLVALVLSVMGIMGPTMGALVHNIGSCLVVLFAGMLYDHKFSMDESLCETCEDVGRCVDCPSLKKA